MNNELTRSLKFIESFENFIPFLSRHLESVQSAFEDFLTTNIVDPDLAKGFRSLSSAGIARLISSPYFAELVAHWKECKNEAPRNHQQIRAKIFRALVAEIKLEDQSFQHFIDPIWTVSGDQVLKPDIARKFPPLQTRCGIGINYQSYAQNSNTEGIGGYSHEMGRIHRERIETARDIVAQVSFPANSLIEMYLTSIQFRVNEGRPNVVNSSSHRAIGVVFCDNFHKIHHDMPEIVDMLVHESIHQHLHIYEEQVSPFLNLREIPTELLESREFSSPWSGKRLDIGSYTHAILVWYGLINFWKQYIENPFWHVEVTPKSAQNKLNEALTGFQNCQSVLDGLGKSRKYLDPSYVKMIQGVEAEVKEKNFELCG